MKKLLLTLFLILSFGTSFYAQTPETYRWEDLFGTQPNQRVEIKGRVVGVHDGDTCTVLDANKTQYKIRFDGIDAPELKQDFGQRAKQNLSDLIFGKDVVVISNKMDKYGRTVGKVIINGTDANLHQIKSGYAWHYKKYQDEQTPEDRIAYAQAETEARAAVRGMWVQISNIIPPWEYRTLQKESQAIDKANRKYEMGAKGGCYYVNASGKKTYVDKKFCNADYVPPAATNKAGDAPTTRTYIKGERGGCYYINSSGKKTYVKKELCGQ
jgi:endonuclease YncB( thermonuclease family)